MIQGQHVMVEINTVFQQLVQVLDKIDPVKLNQTLGAIATAFNGRGEKIGQTLSDFNAFLAKIEPSLPNLSHDIEAAVPTLNAYADAAPDLITTVESIDTDQQTPSSTSSRTSTRSWSARSVWPTSATTWSAATARR